MSTEVKISLERYLQAWNDGDMDAVKETCNPDSVFHQPPLPDGICIETHLAYVAAFQTAMPDGIAIAQLLLAGRIITHPVLVPVH